MNYRRFFFTLLAAAVLALAGSSARASGLPGGQAAKPTGEHSAAALAGPIYLPMIYGRPIPASGRVTDNNTPAVGQVIKVMRSTNTGASYSQVDQIVTGANGMYYYNLPVMAPTHRYQLLWDNPTENSNWLNYFSCNAVLPGVTSSVCDINIHDVKMVSPAPGATVNWPITFQWTPRTTTSDTYQVRLFVNATTLLGQTAFLSYRDRVTIEVAPPAAKTNTTYLWSMYLKTPSGEGDAFYFRSISWRDLNGPSLNGGSLENNAEQESWQAGALEPLIPGQPKVEEAQ